MALNPFFLQGTASEQRLVQDLVNEHLSFHGVEVTYIPRKFVNRKTVLEEVQSSKFDDNFAIEAYVNNFDDYSGAGDRTSWTWSCWFKLGSLNGFTPASNLYYTFFSVDEADTIVSYANEIEGWNEEKFKWMIYYEQNTSGEKKKARIEHFINYHDNLNTLLRNKLMPVVDYIYGEEVNLFKDKMNWKYGEGKGFKPHQDHPAWTDFAPKKYVSMALFANNTTVDNGCLHHQNFE